MTSGFQAVTIKDKPLDQGKDAYGDTSLEKVDAWLDETNPTRIAQAANTYLAAAKRVAATRDLIKKKAQDLADAWDDEGAEEAQKALYKLWYSADQVATSCQTTGDSLKLLAEQLTWYKAKDNRPGYGAHTWDEAFKSKDAHWHARNYLQRLNKRIMEAHAKIPPVVTQDLPGLTPGDNIDGRDPFKTNSAYDPSFPGGVDPSAYNTKNPYGNDLKDPFGNGKNPYGDGQDPYGDGKNPYGNGQDPYGNGKNPYGNGTDPYGNGTDPYGNGTDPYGNGGTDPYGNGSSIPKTDLAGYDPNGGKLPDFGSGPSTNLGNGHFPSGPGVGTGAGTGPGAGGLPPGRLANAPGGPGAAGVNAAEAAAMRNGMPYMPMMPGHGQPNQNQEQQSSTFLVDDSDAFVDDHPVSPALLGHTPPPPKDGRRYRQT